MLGGSLALNGKDSKIHVVDYEAGKTSILYSSGEIATWWAAIIYDSQANPMLIDQ